MVVVEWGRGQVTCIHFLSMFIFTKGRMSPWNALAGNAWRIKYVRRTQSKVENGFRLELTTKFSKRI